MSNGDRGYEPTTLGIFGALAALILCCFIVGILSFSNGQEAERRDKTPAAYAESAKGQAQKDCRNLEGDAAFECIYEKVEASKQQAHDEQDLTAQQKSANGTMITAALAFLGLIASVVGIGLVYTTFTETRRSNEISREGVELQALFGRGYLAGVWGWIMEKDGALVAEMYGGGGEKNDLCLQSVKWSLAESCAYPKNFDHFLSVSKMCPPNQSGPIFNINLSACNVTSGAFLVGVASYMTIGRTFEYYFSFRVSPIGVGDTNPNCKFRLIDAKGEDWPENT